MVETAAGVGEAELGVLPYPDSRPHVSCGWLFLGRGLKKTKPGYMDMLTEVDLWQFLDMRRKWGHSVMGSSMEKWGWTTLMRWVF